MTKQGQNYVIDLTLSSHWMHIHCSGFRVITDDEEVGVDGDPHGDDEEKQM
jgi:hypothetical protein